jgi:hypothetical protein
MGDWRANLVDDDEESRILRESGASPCSASGGAVAGLLRLAYLQALARWPRSTDLAGSGCSDRVVGARHLDGADVIDVFRRPAFLPGHAAEILALPWRPAVVWFQLGIRHDGAAGELAGAGIKVVQDRCMMPEHRRLLGPR